MNRVASYLQLHKRVRITALGVSFSVASVALYIGIGVYVFTLGPKAVGDYIRDRFMAGCLIGLALVVDLGTAAVLVQRGEGLLSRLLFSVLVTVGGAILAFGLVVARAMIAQALSAQ